MQELPLNKAFMLLEPGPVVLVSTAAGGKSNIMTLSWHMVMDFTPKFALVTGAWNYSYKALLKTKECVIAIPAFDISQKVVKSECAPVQIPINSKSLNSHQSKQNQLRLH